MSEISSRSLVKRSLVKSWRSAVFTSLAVLIASVASAESDVTIATGPAYDFDRRELESILEDLVAWLPGEWSSEPQLHYERNVRMPAEGEHDPWYRSFSRIDAPQIGSHVFYGQVNIAGREGPLFSRTQVLYKASIDEARGIVLIRGQAMADAEPYVNLQDRPELWSQVRMNENAVNCDFVWRRDGDQIVGVLEGRTVDKRRNGPGTCTFTATSGKEFFSDAEWVLSPETLWIYDINKLDGTRFNGREDRTHTRLSRARPYTCRLRDLKGERAVESYDRGGKGTAQIADGAVRYWMLLRASYPAADGFGLDDELRLTLHESEHLQPLKTSRATPRADRITLEVPGINIDCSRQEKFGPMPPS